MITKRQYIILSFFLTRSLFFGVGVSKIINTSSNDAWISAILGTIIGLGIISFLYYIKKNESKFFNLFNKNTISVIAKIVLFLLACFCLNNVILSLTTMTTSFLLPLSPPIFIGILILVTILYANIHGIKSIAKVGEILFYGSILIFLIKLISSFMMLDINNFLPILYKNTNNVLYSSLLYGILSATPSFLLLAIDDVKLSYKDSMLGYILGSVSIVLSIFTIIGVLNPTLANILRYPEYMALKKIRILNFIENIENILTFIWYFDLIILGFISAYNIKKITNYTLNNKSISKVTYIIICLVITFIGGFVLNKYYTYTLTIYSIEPFICGIFIIILCLLFIILKKLLSK